MNIQKLENKKEIKYGLKYKGEFLFVEKFEHDDGDIYKLVNYQTDNGIWLVSSIQNAEFVRFNSTEYYNADYSIPINNYNYIDLEIFKIEIELKTQEEKVQCLDSNNLLSAKFNFINEENICLYCLQKGCFEKYSERTYCKSNKEKEIKVLKYDDNYYKLIYPSKIYNFNNLFIKKENVRIKEE